MRQPYFTAPYKVPQTCFCGTCGKCRTRKCMRRIREGERRLSLPFDAWSESLREEIARVLGMRLACRELELYAKKGEI